MKLRRGNSELVAQFVEDVCNLIGPFNPELMLYLENRLKEIEDAEMVRCIGIAQNQIEEAVRAEREACARVVEDYRFDKYGQLDGVTLLNAAALIRAREK